MSAATSDGLLGSELPLAPGRLRSAWVLTSPMPSTKFFWHEYWIGSFQLVMTGKPSIQVVLVASVAEPMSLYSGTLPSFLK